MEEDPFDTVQNLERQFYNEGYALGLEDGTKAGLLEGRFFGLEKGFDKFVEMGKLRGRSIVWSSRLSSTGPHDLSISIPPDTSPSTLQEEAGHLGSPDETSKEQGTRGAATTYRLLQFPYGVRLGKHLHTFHALSEPESLDTHNSEDAVSEYDERLKRAKTKAKIIEKLIGEESTSMSNSLGESNADDASIEDANILNARH